MDTGLESKLRQAIVLVSRLERISADSYWAHRASGLRVALLRLIDRIDISKSEMNSDDSASMDCLLEQGYWILGKVAGNMRGKLTDHGCN